MPVPIGERTFSAGDQRWFASVSLDCNPMHMDPVAARRLISGGQVVHGMHVLLTALECWQYGTDAHPVSIGCSFNNPVSVGDRVAFTQHPGEGGETILEAAVNGVLCSRIIVETAPSTSPDAVGHDPGRQPVAVDGLASPLEEAPEMHVGREYAVKPNAADLSARFPRACRRFGSQAVAQICALSYFVGMVCPGLHSIFSSLTLGLGQAGAAPGPLLFQVRKYDHRVGLFDIAFRGAIQGSIKAFLRPPPQAQPSMQELQGQVAAGEFSATRALVLGGSRGLGEITAKILASGGGNVVITYATGRDDARRICDEINHGGKGSCAMLRVDLAADSFAALEIDRDSLDAVYYFPTPRIFRKKTGIFDPGLFREFTGFYIEKFYDLCAYLEAGNPPAKIRVCFPSSVFVSERPKGMTEYAMAKAAAEVLIDDINRSFRKLTVLATRLPRLNTDQTTSIMKLATGSNVEALLPVIRQMHA